ncbi:hypothetical protein [Streptomyces sp. NPDC055681]
MARSWITAIRRDQVMRLLAEDGLIPCRHCRHDTELSMLWPPIRCRLSPWQRLRSLYTGCPGRAVGG